MCRTRFFEVVPVGALSPCVVTFPGEANGNSRGEVNSGWLVCRAPSASCLSLPLFFCTHTHTHSSACTDSSRTAFLRLSSPLFPSLGFLLSDGSPPWQVERIRVCRCPGVRRNVGRIRTRFVMESHREVAARNFRLILRLSKFLSLPAWKLDFVRSFASLRIECLNLLPTVRHVSLSVRLHQKC